MRKPPGWKLPLHAALAVLLACAGGCEPKKTATVNTEKRTGPGTEYDGVELSEPKPVAEKADAVRIEIQESRIIRPFSKELFGLNYDWRGMEKVLLDSHGEHQEGDAVRLLQGIPLPLNRMAGTDSQHFRWKDSLGSLAERKPQKLWNWEKASAMRVGPIEFLKFVTNLDPQARFVWVLNLEGDSPQDMADLAKFLTGSGPAKPDGGIDWAERRRSLGLEHPVKVAIWEIGNEMDFGADAWPVEKYIDVSRQAIQAIKSVDPNAKIALHALTAPWSAPKEPWRQWHRRVLKALGSEIDYLAFHPYYEGLPIRVIERYMDEIHADIREITGSDRIKLFVSEHARWPAMPKDGPWSRNWYQTHSLEGCLATAAFLTRCLDRPDVGAATYHSFSSGPWGLLYRDQERDRIFATGIAKMFRLFGTIDGGDVVFSSASAQDEDMRLVVAAVRNDDSLNVILVNRGSETQVSISPEKNYRIRSSGLLTGPGLNAYDTLGKETISLKIEDISGKRSETLQSLDLPAHSMLVLKLDAIR